MLAAVNPLHAVRFSRDNGWHGFMVLCTVFLVITGGVAAMRTLWPGDRSGDSNIFLGREIPLPTPKVPGMSIWREKLFAFMARNSQQATAFFNIPPDRVVEIGQQVEI